MSSKKKWNERYRAPIDAGTAARVLAELAPRAMPLELLETAVGG